jgi:Region found in RelA / SpoT proteins
MTPLDSAPGGESSPLGMLTDAPSLHELVGVLQRFRDAYEGRGDPGPLVFSRRHIAEARGAFGELIRRGEERLHQLCSLLAEVLLGEYELQSVVIGEVANTHERFRLAIDLTPEQLYATTDLDLGRRQLDRLRFVQGETTARATLVSNVVEYLALSLNRHGVFRLLSRVKAEEEIWNKVADEIFNLDGLVLRDKELRHLSRFVKDVFGVKIVVAEEADVYRVHEALTGLELPPQLLARFSLPPGTPASRLEFVEVKDYLGREHRKRTGWKAMKSVVRWADRTFEIQLQPLGNFLHERERLTRESHAGFKARREELRGQVARQLPLFGYYLELLRWLFSGAEGVPPSLAGVQVRLEA